MSKLKLMLTLIPFFLLLTNCLALLEPRIVCNDSEYLHEFSEFTACEGNNCTDYNYSQYRNCTYGCDNVTNSCRSSPITEYSMYFGIMALLLIASGVIIRVWRR